MRRITPLLAMSLLLLAACVSPNSPSEGATQITIFFTSDEHGYLEPWEDGAYTVGGGANLMSYLRAEGYDPARDLLLSGGDMWTGPAISSWFQGASTVEVFNAMGYDASALGNHDFDFGQEVLAVRAAEAQFPFLSANLTDDATGDVPAFADPYAIIDVDGVNVGVIGLSLRTTPDIVMPAYVEGLTFGDYGAALRETVPLARDAGAEVLVVIAHVCPDSLTGLTSTAAELGISLLAGGHCHSLSTTERDGVLVVGAGSHWEAVVRIDLYYADGEVIEGEASRLNNRYRASGEARAPAPGVEDLVESWAAQNDELLGEAVGYTATGVEEGWAMYNMTTQSWLWYYPQADVAITNAGGFRDVLPPGDITLADLVAVFPFENTLVDVELSGEELLENLRCCGGVVGGITVRGSGASMSVTLDDGAALDPQATYHVLVNSYIYSGGDGYLFSGQDPDAYDTGIHWREPVVQWLRAHPTSTSQPLESLLDDTARTPWY